ncbi:SusC/RagA family TonB-linked outer membrane protein [Muriicola sp. Z0-33]|uniref:SusC/RagA family TonB-linked outer membrane protein n=1 Tax=Muriicola sp. Z0-33 TaxID=2816957 RepID=UPI0022386DA7|nr:SusC/RagA family TonB-linked outer membrane protein [Muriicola sp. Z0-33]MCW5515076.1 SusC/RagA family TonB-linked outer membrane protein [Muriicola sp. Z0-33]
MKITLLRSFILVGALLCFSMVEAQDVSGTVSDSNGPLPGASVVVKGTTNGTQTDFDGNYSLSNVDSNATLVFSYIGFATQEVAVNGQSTINVTLQEDAQALDEVVIIGYGTTTVKDATGAVTAVTAEDFNGGVIASPEQLIQGKTAGVNISQSSGEPGAGISINIRGSNSVRANNNPLFVVDGVPLSGENTSPSGDAGNGGANAVRNPLNFLNPADIESISVLKDASATAIYGSRGANGVVIITTKSGKAASGGVIEFSSSLSISTPADSYDLLNADEFVPAVFQFNPNADLATTDFGFDTNWQDFITRTAVSTNNNISYANNYGKGNVRATFGYSKQFGVIEKTDLERITGRINARHRFLDDKLTLSLSATFSRVNDETAPLAGGAGFRGDILGASYSANPTWPASPSFSNLGGLINPANQLANTQIRTNTDRVLLNGSAEYSFTSELKGKVNIGYDKSDSQNVSVISGNVLNLTGIAGQGFGVYNTLERENTLLEATLNWKKDYDNSSVDVLVGYSFQDFQTMGRNAAGRGFGTTDLNQMGNDLRETVNGAANTISGSYQQYYYGSNTTGLLINRLLPNVVAQEEIAFGFNRNVQGMTADTFDNTDELQSFFGRINFTYAGKYLFTGTLRADGSSRFGPENQYGYFPSGAFAWQIGEEDFIGESVSTLKLRLSAGVTGNQDGLGYGNFVARQRFGGLVIENDSFVVNPNGLAIVATDVPDLKWEPTLNLNVGLDFGFNNDRFSGSIDVYKNETTDVLLRTPPAAPAVDPFQFGNVDAKIVNQGIEVALAYDWIQQEDVSFSSSFNIAYNENEVQDFGGLIDTGAINGQGLSGAFAQRFAAGRSLFSYYMAEYTGLDSAGQPTFADQNGDGVGDVFQDKVFVGEDALPDVTAGLSLNLNVKNWDFSAYFTGQFGFSVYNNTANGLFTSGSLTNARNVTVALANSGEAPGTSADVSTRYLEKGDFVRFQNATLGYNWPLEDKTFFKSLRLSLTGQNLFLITDYSGLDPEITTATGDLGSGVPTRGIDWAAFPNPRTITFGINASF